MLELCKVYVKLDQPNTAIETYLKSSSVRAHPYLCAYIFSQIILFLFNLQAQTRMIFFLLLYIYIYIYICCTHNFTKQSQYSPTFAYGCSKIHSSDTSVLLGAARIYDMLNDVDKGVKLYTKVCNGSVNIALILRLCRRFA